MMCRPVVESRLPVGSSAKHDRRIVGQRPGDGDALLLAARQLRRIVMRAIGQADFVEQRIARARWRRGGRRSPSAPGRSRTRSATAPGGRTGRRSRSSRRAAARDRLRSSFVMSTPSMRISPVLGASRPASSPSSVDLPLPDGPTMATNAPRRDRVVERMQDGERMTAALHGFRDAAQFDHSPLHRAAARASSRCCVRRCVRPRGWDECRLR